MVSRIEEMCGSSSTDDSLVLAGASLAPRPALPARKPAGVGKPAGRTLASKLCRVVPFQPSRSLPARARSKKTGSSLTQKRSRLSSWRAPHEQRPAAMRAHAHAPIKCLQVAAVLT